MFKDYIVKRKFIKIGVNISFYTVNITGDYWTVIL